MQIRQVLLTKASNVGDELDRMAEMTPHWVVMFGSGQVFEETAVRLAAVFPEARRMGCSTAGEISSFGVSDETCVLTAVRFAEGRVLQASTRLVDMEDSHAAGRRLASQLPLAGLRAVFVLGQGVRINGSALLRGIGDVLGQDLPISGGLAGDGGAFRETRVLDDVGVSSETIVAVGFYGASLTLFHGSFGGWSPFGPARRVTRSVGNVLYELDGEPALAIYKRYLGEHAKGLPASGLLFPFAMLGSDHQELGLIRTILGVNEQEGSLTLAGEIHPDGYLKLMHASTDALVNGAGVAAEAAGRIVSGEGGQSLGLLVSCVGRKLIMGGRVDEEVEAVSEVLGQRATLAGFYSYGEFSPFSPFGGCQLHNQTMTITCICES